MKIGKIIAIICVFAAGLLTTPNIVKAQNDPPWFGDNQIPLNESVDIGLTPTCAVGIYDYDDEELTVSFYENTTGEFVLVQTTVTPYSIVVYEFENATQYNTTYWWKAVVSDGVNEVSEIYHFTTIEEGETPNSPPVANFTYEVDGFDLTVNSTSTDSDGNITNWYWLFGDGNQVDGEDPYENTNHTYSENGTYTVTHIVIDNDNATDYISKEITIGSTGGGGTIDIGDIPTWTWYVIGVIIIAGIFIAAAVSKKKSKSRE